MNDSRAEALARLRAADPATDTPDPRTPQARALLEQVLATADTPPPATSRRRRRFALGFAAAAAAAVTATFAVVLPASAYTVDQRADGSVAVVIRASQLDDPARLNRALARAGARTVALEMVPADRCPTPPDADPAFPMLVDPTPEELAASLARFPVDYRQGDGTVLITIRPWLIPAAETLVLGYAVVDGRGDRTTYVRPVVVRSLPACLAIPTPPHR
ncbi:hypothetical protein Cs7R123_25940 [Catellatospora sp. TT07R-123]|uniref:hypothetical protein n=1 Tax=Catellatospora sp. TT07R-123 TaxID=2733863 RepID=UPI001B0BF0CF|nr:hypothetical protein [Catellatospora sp. TT07R-123]GHJ45252.1 hypothetical protein Cs7R123_25940 [Catellatospora sp. TT07R-123]